MTERVRRVRRHLAEVVIDWAEAASTGEREQIAAAIAELTDPGRRESLTDGAFAAMREHRE